MTKEAENAAHAIINSIVEKKQKDSHENLVEIMHQLGYDLGPEHAFPHEDALEIISENDLILYAFTIGDSRKTKEFFSLFSESDIGNLLKFPFFEALERLENEEREFKIDFTSLLDLILDKEGNFKYGITPSSLVKSLKPKQPEQEQGWQQEEYPLPTNRENFLIQLVRRVNPELKKDCLLQALGMNADDLYLSKDLKEFCQKMGILLQQEQQNMEDLYQNWNSKSAVERLAIIGISRILTFTQDPRILKEFIKQFNCDKSLQDNDYHVFCLYSIVASLDSESENIQGRLKALLEPLSPEQVKDFLTKHSSSLKYAINDLEDSNTISNLVSEDSANFALFILFNKLRNSKIEVIFDPNDEYNGITITANAEEGGMNYKFQFADLPEGAFKKISELSDCVQNIGADKSEEFRSRVLGSLALYAIGNRKEFVQNERFAAILHGDRSNSSLGALSDDLARSLYYSTLPTFADFAARQGYRPQPEELELCARVLKETGLSFEGVNDRENLQRRATADQSRPATAQARDSEEPPSTTPFKAKAVAANQNSPTQSLPTQ